MIFAKLTEGQVPETIVAKREVHPRTCIVGSAPASKSVVNEAKSLMNNILCSGVLQYKVK